MIKTVFDLFLRIFFPKICISCNREGSHLCEDCVSIIPINTWLYPLLQPSFLNGLFCATPYQNTLIQTIINQYKNPPFLKDLSLQLTYCIISHFIYVHNAINIKDFHIVPIPLQKDKLRWRGFDQTKEIAKELSSSLHLPLDTITLQCKRKGIFHANSSVNKNILLVDDVYRTGTTMEAAAKALKEAGAKTIWGVVVARG